MATLVTRPGDPQALKAAAAAAAAGASLAVMPMADASWKRLLTAGAPLAAEPQLLLVLPDGSALTEANAMARFLAGSLGAATSIGEETWLEWEAHTLRPAALSGDAAALAAAVERLVATGASPTRFLSPGGAAPGLADWAVCATLAGLGPGTPVRPRITGCLPGYCCALLGAEQRGCGFAGREACEGPGSRCSFSDSSVPSCLAAGAGGGAALPGGGGSVAGHGRRHGERPAGPAARNLRRR